MTVFFAGGIAITAFGLLSAVNIHRQIDRRAPEKYAGRIRKLSDNAAIALKAIESIKRIEPGEIDFYLSDLAAIYLNSRLFVKLAAAEANGSEDAEILDIHSRLARTHEKVVVAIFFCLLEKLAGKLVKRSMRVYGGHVAWLYNEEVVLLDILSYIPDRGTALAGALERL